MKIFFKKFMVTTAVLFSVSAAQAATLDCKKAGPQTPRDIASVEGSNGITFDFAPKYKKLNLCNIHTHTNAEHKGPGFSVLAGKGKHGGYKCNETSELSEAELENPYKGHAPYGNVKPGDTIEVHWVHSSCDVKPGEGLGSCLTDDCENPQLRVEAQVFLLVNDTNALDFNDYVYGTNTNRNGFQQAKAIPKHTGKPVVFLGSTTGPKYTQKECSPLQVTWSVRPQCAKLDINSLYAWAEKGNVFKEDHSHGVRQLVTKPELLAPIQKVFYW